MIRIHLLLVCFLLIGTSNNSFSQDISLEDSTGLPGDHFDLAAALEMLKQSGSPEEFEKNLNKEENGVNNLDLNGDGTIDYIQVVEFSEGDVHAFALRIAVNKEESQDIAVIDIEKTDETSARLQIIGDEELYGNDAILEPYDEVIQGGKSGPSPATEIKVVFVNVWTWGFIRFIYRPNYVVWASPYYWGYYPPFWKPWKPYGWRHYRKRMFVYGPMYHYNPVFHLKKAHGVYWSHKAHSIYVGKKYAPAHTWHKQKYGSNAYHGGKQSAPIHPNTGKKTGPKSKPTIHKNSQPNKPNGSNKKNQPGKSNRPVKSSGKH